MKRAKTGAVKGLHPGEILSKKFMEPAGLSATRLALALRLAPSRLSEIMRGRRSITVDTALRLEHYFSVEAEFWLGLQTDYDLRVARAADGGRTAREVKR